MLPAQAPTKPYRVEPAPVDPADLPPGVDHNLANEVLSYYLTGGEDHDVNDLGSALNLAVRTVIQIIDCPFVVRILADIKRLAHQRSEIAAAEARTRAVYVTRRIASNSRSDEVARRAANALLNFRTYTPPPSRAGTPSDPDDAPPPSPPPRRPARSPHTEPSNAFRVPPPAPSPRTAPGQTPPAVPTPRPAATAPTPATTSPAANPHQATPPAIPPRTPSGIRAPAAPFAPAAAAATQAAAGAAPPPLAHITPPARASPAA